MLEVSHRGRKASSCACPCLLYTSLKKGTIETAKESQRGVVDIETLQQTNKSLIETLDELNKIKSEGRAKRAAAEQELNLSLIHI